MAKKHKSRGSAEAEKFAYQRLSFWIKKRFWLTTYRNRPDIIDYYENWLSKWAESQKNLSTIEPTLR